jgi:large subunit ribosomal protein L9
MEVILIKDIPSLGKTGDVVKVATGYARNFLLPKNFALTATPQNMKQLGTIKKRDDKIKEKEKLSAQALKERIEAISLTMKKHAGEEDKLFGSVTSPEIVEALLEMGIEVDKRKVVIEEHIKRLGDYTVPIKLASEIVAHLRLSVVKEDQGG